jgi:metal-responsive CopG/Arc/MetJ family transcriptional regulator
MKNKAQKIIRVTISVPEDLLESFKEYCDRQYRPLSTQIQFMMSAAIEREKTINENH